MRLSPWLPICAVAALAACDHDPTTGPDRVRVPARLNPAYELAVVAADSVAWGAPLTVVVTSSVYCGTKGETDVTVRGLVAEIRPYDYHLLRGGCVDMVYSVTHTATVEFVQEGVATLRVIGVGEMGRRVVIERPVRVYVPRPGR